MPQNRDQKILPFIELVQKVEAFKQEGKKVVQVQGVFDLIHPGMILHLDSAKEMGDVLVVTVVMDKDVRRGPGRPVFPEELRLQNVAALGQVDFACLVDDEKPYGSVKILKPDVFAKGQVPLDRDKETHRKIFEKERELFWGKTKVRETDGFAFSSTGFLSRFLDIYPEDTREFLRQFFEKHPFNDIADSLHSLEKLKVLLVGDGIVDEYHYCHPMGKAAKSNLVVNKYIDHEVFAGGAFAIANHAAGVCGQVDMVTLLGEEDSREQYVRDNLKPNVMPKFFFRPDGPTVIKTRFVHQYLNQKLFEVNYINDVYIDGKLEQDIIDYLARVTPEYDLVLISDFGHGFVTQGIHEVLREKAKVLAVNTQTNAANSGYNLITKYHRPDFVCLDETEIRLAAQAKYEPVDEIARKIKERTESNHLIVTLGKQGAIGIGPDGQIARTPIFSTKVLDTIGAGDAFFAFTAPFVQQGAPMDVVTFIGNSVGALAVQIIGNKRPVEKHELLEFIHSLAK